MSQEPTGDPSPLRKHGYVIQTLASLASGSQRSGFPPATFPVGSAGSRITGLRSNIERGTAEELGWVSGV